MYWTDWGTDKIQRADLDGSGVEDLVTGLNQPRGIALDLGDGRMYWPDWGTDKIQRANLDGSGVEDLVTSAGLLTPQAIALDAGGGKMYWTDYGTDKIQRANLNGSQVEDLVTSGLKEPYGLALGAGLPAQIFKAGGDSATLNLAGRFRDPDGGAVTLSVSSSDEAVATAALADSQVTIAPVAPGQITVAVTARDERGRAATLLVPVTVYPPNRPPVAQALADRKVRIDSLARVELSEAFTDPDVGDVLTYTATSSDEAVATAAVEGSGVNIAPKSPGQARISVTARDPEGLEASLSFGVTVEPKPPPPPPPPPPRPPPRPRPPPPPPPRPPTTNQVPVFDEGASANRSVAENTPPDRNIGNPVGATDPEGRAVSYSLTGGDTDRFTIIPQNGQLRTRTGVDYNYEAQNRYSVRVEAQDEQGGRATIAVTIDVTDDDNERPERPDQPTVTASTLTSLTIGWTAPANPGPPITDYNVRYREGSGGAFTAAAHDGIRTTTTISNLKSNTSYEIQVQATSDEGTSQWSDSGNGRTVANQAPIFTDGTSTTRRLAENTTGTTDIGNPITASDGDGGTLTYHLEGTDRASFTLDVNELQTQSGETYDYEEKSSYVVIVRVQDGQGGSNTIEVAINLIDQQEPPETPSAPSVSAASSMSLTVTWDEPTNTGPDIDDYDIQYREGDSGGFTPWTHNSAEHTATITGRSPGTSYQVQVRALNDEGTSDWSPSGTGSTGANGLPVFTDGSSATRALDENTTGVQDIGDPVSATDPENTPLTYSLEGQDADAFTIDTRSGQLRTKSDQTYDYETKPRYVVDVKATDGHGGSSTILVLINLNDVNEPPAFTSDAAFETVENGATVGAVVAQDEDSADHITGYTLTGGTDRDRFEINSGGVLTFKNDPDFEDPKDNGRNNEYIVVVTATGGSGGRALTAEQTITVTVTDVNEPPGKPDPPTVSNETDNSLTVRWAEPANTGPDVTNYHVQYRDSGAFTDWPDTGPSLTRTITGLSSGSTYQIRVQAENDEGKGAWSNSVNGTTLTGSSPTILRGPYLQSGTSSSVIIKWRTDDATENVVHYGLDPNSLTLSASNSTSTTEHAVQLTGLSADVKYFYSVGTSSVTLAGGDRDHFVVTAPVPGTAKPTRIWVIGDSGTANGNARAVRDAFLEFTESRDPDLWIMLGDNAYDEGNDVEYQAAVFETYPQVLPRTVLWPTLGNHDGRSADSTTESGPYYDIFSLPRNGEAGGVASGTEAYYSFDYGNMHFICLDSYETDRSADGAMMTWLEADLQANDKEWIIAFWHHGPYSKGPRDSDEVGRSILLRENAVPLLERYGVDLVLTGHSHAYERTYLIDGHYGFSDTFTDAMKKNPGDGSATGDGAYQKPAAVGAPRAGAVYVVAGTAGYVKPGPFNHPAVAVSIETLGSMVLDVNGSRLDAMFLDSTGNIRDDFTILKGPDTTSPQIWSVQAQGTPTRTVVTFFENVEQASAETASNYAIDNGVTVSAAGLGGGGRTVTLTTTPLTGGITYTLTVNNVVDLAGNPIATDSQEQFQYNIITDSFQEGVAPTAGYAGTTDTYMSSNAPTSNFGSSAMLLLDGDDPGGSGNDLASLLKWDISSIPPGSPRRLSADHAGCFQLHDGRLRDLRIEKQLGGSRSKLERLRCGKRMANTRSPRTTGSRFSRVRYNLTGVLGIL